MAHSFKFIGRDRKCVTAFAFDSLEYPTFVCPIGSGPDSIIMVATNMGFTIVLFKLESLVLFPMN